MTKHFKKEELAHCFRENGSRCRECPLKQPANKLPDGVEENLEALVVNVLEPACLRLGKPITVNSGYRCPKHNRAIGGATTSQHLRGEAADVAPVQGSRFTVQDLAKAIVANGKWDQMILYPTFVHVSYKRNGGNRRQILRKTATGYEKVEVKELR